MSTKAGPSGALKTVTLGNGVVETTGLDNRLRANRRAANTGPGLLLVAPTAGTQFGGNNRIAKQQNGVDLPGTPYVNAGNLIAHPNPGAMTYDGENRMVSAVSAGAPSNTASYEYDGEGRRVRRTVGTDVSVYLHDAFGKLAAELGPVAAGDAGPQYLTGDHLGSTRLVTNVAGAVAKGYDYLPFGEGLTASRPACFQGETNQQYPANDKQAVRFTGQMRDGETGLDFFGARFYSGALGRFTSVDEVFADQDPSDPMSWNLMAYVRDNPLRYTDPDGRVCRKSGSNYQDDANPGPDCRMMLLGDWKAARYEVTEQGPPSDLLLAVAEGARSAEPAVNLAGAGFKTFGMFANSLLTLAVTCLAGDPDWTSEEIGFAMVPAGLLPGQLHHAISRKVARALSRHPILRNAYKARDSLFVALAKDKASHTGYQTWLRRLDEFVVSWVENNKGASTHELEGVLRDLYSRSADLINRFPLGLK